MGKANVKRLGDLLVESGVITENQLMDALKRQKHTGKRLGQILIDENIVKEEDIIDVLEIQLGIPRIYLDFIEIDDKVSKTVPENIARKYTLVPISVNGNKLKIAMSDPLNIFAIDDVELASGCTVESMIASTGEIKGIIEKIYSGQKVEKVAEEFSKEHKLKVKKEDKQLLEEMEDINRAPIVKLVDLILDDAIKAGCSDIHIEPFERFLKVRYRIDGELCEKKRLPMESHGPLITRIKILSNLNIAEKRVPQDGRMKVKLDNKDVDLRISVLPTIFGEKVVIRILKSDNVHVGKEKLGMDKLNIERLEKMIKKPYGIILVTGPTGSGKSTTLYTILNELNSENKNIITVEDPVEYVLEGINQVNVNTKAGLTFASGLKSILRQDPDIVMIGEMRDAETAEIASRAALTGHLVLSTLHTNDSVSSIIRLVDMGIPPYLVATSLAGVIAQRLAKKICPHCKEEYTAGDYEKEILRVPKSQDLKLFRGKGCPKCNGRGYAGRIGVYEIMEVSKEHKEYINENKSVNEIRELSIQKGMITIKESCRKLVLEGKTTIEEFMRIAFFRE